MGEIWAGKALMSVHNIVKSERAIQEEKKTDWDIYKRKAYISMFFKMPSKHISVFF